MKRPRKVPVKKAAAPISRRLEEMIYLLNGDLSNEYKHLHFYLHHISVVKTLHAVGLREFFEEEAEGEFKHVQEFQNLIIGLGGEPEPDLSRPFKKYHDPLPILMTALQMEDEVVANYTQRIEQANMLGGVDGKFIEIFLEDQIMDSRKDADKIRRFVKV